MGRQHEPVVEQDRHRGGRVQRQCHRHGGDDPRLPSFESCRGAHRWRCPIVELGLLRRAYVHTDERRLQARPRLVRRVGGQESGRPAAGVRVDQQCRSGHRVDRCQQLRVRRHRSTLRHQLVDVAVVVEELLLRRQLREEPVHQFCRRCANQRGCGCAAECCSGDDQCRLFLERLHDHRADLLVADCRREAGFATASRVGAARAPVDVVSGTATPTGPTTPRWSR